MTEIVKGDENLFLALGFPPHEAEILQLRADLMGKLRLWIQDSGLTQAIWSVFPRPDANR